MAQFREEALRLISGYKKIVKRQLPQGAAGKKFRELGIKSRQLAAASEVALYLAAQKIHENITTEIEKSRQTTYEYSGLAEYDSELSKLLNLYFLRDERVINKQFVGSRALLNTIQLITVPINDQNREKLEENLHSLASFGTREQIAKVIHTLQVKSSENQTNFQPYIESLMRSYKQIDA